MNFIRFSMCFVLLSALTSFAFTQGEEIIQVPAISMSSSIYFLSVMQDAIVYGCATTGRTDILNKAPIGGIFGVANEFFSFTTAYNYHKNNFYKYQIVNKCVWSEDTVQLEDGNDVYQYPILAMVKCADGNYHGIFPAVLKTKVNYKAGQLIHANGYAINASYPVKAGDVIPVLCIGNKEGDAPSLLSIEATKGAGAKPWFSAFPDCATMKDNDIAISAWRTEKERASLSHDFSKIILAAIIGDAERVKALITAGADGASKNHALWFAASLGYTACVKMLIAAHADVNAQYDMSTPLMVSAYSGYADIVNILLAAGADANIKLNDNMALSLAQSGIDYNLNGHDASEYQKIILALQKSGADALLHQNVNQTNIPAPSSTASTESSVSKINPKDGAELILIPVGEFLMGSTEEDFNALKTELKINLDLWLAEIPQHKVYLDAYYIYKNDVTVAQYKKFCAATGRQMPKEPDWGWCDDNPIVNVSWEDANAYAQWAGASLPTEAQWEKAARGSDGRKYPWGNEWDASKCQCSKESPIDAGKTAPVGSFPAGASPYGVLDMAGNVIQWCADWYDANYYAQSPASNPTGPATGNFRVQRGGRWLDCRSEYMRVCCRIFQNPTCSDSSDYYGFRCVYTSSAVKVNTSPKLSPRR